MKEEKVARRTREVYIHHADKDANVAAKQLTASHRCAVRRLVAHLEQQPLLWVHCGRLGA